MTNLSKDLREKLKEVAIINRIEPAAQQKSQDGTIKFLFKLNDEDKDFKVEAVLIPDFFDDGVAKRLTVCVSSQVGCVFGCSFCATGKMGFFRNLSHGEVVDQVHISTRFLKRLMARRSQILCTWGWVSLCITTRQ